MTNDEKILLTRDPVSSDYKAAVPMLVEVRVPAEILNRMILKTVGEDETANLTDPATWVKVIEQVGNPQKWLDHPQATITPLKDAPVVVRSVPSVPALPLQRKEIPSPKAEKGKTKLQLLEEEICERARHVPPHCWLDSDPSHHVHDSLVLSPVLPMSESADDRASRGRLRYDESQILKKLLKKTRQEWEQEGFILDAEAAEQEELYQRTQTEKLEVKLETVALVVNGSRFN